MAVTQNQIEALNNVTMQGYFNRPAIYFKTKVPNTISSINPDQFLTDGGATSYTLLQAMASYPDNQYGSIFTDALNLQSPIQSDFGAPNIAGAALAQNPGFFLPVMSATAPVLYFQKPLQNLQPRVKFTVSPAGGGILQSIQICIASPSLAVPGGESSNIQVFNKHEILVGYVGEREFYVSEAPFQDVNENWIYTLKPLDGGTLNVLNSESVDFPTGMTVASRGMTVHKNLACNTPGLANWMVTPYEFTQVITQMMKFFHRDWNWSRQPLIGVSGIPPFAGHETAYSLFVNELEMRNFMESLKAVEYTALLSERDQSGGQLQRGWGLLPQIPELFQFKYSLADLKKPKKLVRKLREAWDTFISYNPGYAFATQNPCTMHCGRELFGPLMEGMEARFFDDLGGRTNIDAYQSTIDGKTPMPINNIGMLFRSIVSYEGMELRIRYNPALDDPMLSSRKSMIHPNRGIHTYTGLILNFGKMYAQSQRGGDYNPMSENGIQFLTSKNFVTGQPEFVRTTLEANGIVNQFGLPKPSGAVVQDMNIQTALIRYWYSFAIVLQDGRHGASFMPEELF